MGPSLVLPAARFDLAALGELLSDPSRVTMLLALMDGSRRPASELSQLAGVAPSVLRAGEHADCIDPRGVGGPPCTASAHGPLAGASGPRPRPDLLPAPRRRARRRPPRRPREEAPRTP